MSKINDSGVNHLITVYSQMRFASTCFWIVEQTSAEAMNFRPQTNPWLGIGIPRHGPQIRYVRQKNQRPAAAGSAGVILGNFFELVVGENRDIDATIHLPTIRRFVTSNRLGFAVPHDIEPGCDYLKAGQIIGH